MGTYTLLVLLSLATLVSSSRIIGGSAISISDVPYQLSLRLRGNHVCGASIISEKVGLTAAHCVLVSGPYSIRAGSDNVYKGGVVIHVDKAQIHPKFSTSLPDYDIAILYLQNSVPFSKNIKAVNLPKDGENAVEGAIGRISGWGVQQTVDLYKISETLQTLDVPVWNWQKCKAVYSYQITARNFCAGLKKGGKDSCQGDSGGPFVIKNVLFGIISAGLDCAQPGYPGIYTNVSALRGFIKDYAGV